MNNVGMVGLLLSLQLLLTYWPVMQQVFTTAYPLSPGAENTGNAGGIAPVERAEKIVIA
jgi:hypothetical protein